MSATRPELSARERTEVYARRLAQLVPPLPPDRAPGQPPRLVIVAGQAGAGKSTIQQLIHAAMGAERVARYDLDDIRTVHPRYDAIMVKYGLYGAEAVLGGIPRDLQQVSLDRLRAGEPQYDVVLSAPVHREDLAKAWIDGFRAAGYRISVVYVAVHESGSVLGIADRYQRGRDGTGAGRWEWLDSHDRQYAGVPGTARFLESEAYVDDLYVVDRDGYVLWENHRRADGSMLRTPGAEPAIEAERLRAPTPAEHAYLTATADRLLHGRPPPLPPLEPAVAAMVGKALERAARRPPVLLAPGPARDAGQIAQRVAAAGLVPADRIGRPTEQGTGQAGAGQTGSARTRDGGHRRHER